ncbi:GNAT family N-acetyltransferase [Paenibacillus sp. OAS669]|uniref:GNAT family N-acetyltransferase n=1 Tax=Paenibacillus sp. OAS669 TaxID=2663821 RepID=UPI00178B71C9|nr:GNAT family N-acetyltransferase [Paenibacillus sp. OAS669]MBE1443174.1 putative acetyltransferase [Paenibacillus sp. OAS669]
MLNLQLLPVSYEEKSVLRHIMELYQYDMSEFEDNVDVNSHGLYDYKYIDNYWTEEGRFAFFVKVDGKMAGFALIREHEPLADGTPCYSMAEFFIMRAYRKKGIGFRAAQQIFAHFQGKWSLSYLPRNTVSEKFWRKVIGSCSQGERTETIFRGLPTFEFFTGDFRRCHP